MGHWILVEFCAILLSIVVIRSESHGGAANPKLFTVYPATEKPIFNSTALVTEEISIKTTKPVKTTLTPPPTTTETVGPVIPPLPPPWTVLVGSVVPVFIAIACISYLLCRMKPEHMHRAAFINFPFSFNRPSSPTPSRQEIISNSPPPDYSSTPVVAPPGYDQDEEPPPPYDSLRFETDNSVDKDKDDTTDNA